MLLARAQAVKRVNGPKRILRRRRRKRKVESSSSSESESSEDDAETQLTHAIAATFCLLLAYALKYLCLSIVFVLKEFGM